MTKFSAQSHATLFLRIEAENAREALQAWHTFMTNWTGDKVGKMHVRMVDGLAIVPEWSTEREYPDGRISIAEEETGKLVISCRPCEDTASELQATLLNYIQELDEDFCITPETMIADETPAELLGRAKEFFYHLRNHIMKEWRESRGLKEGGEIHDR